MRIAKVGTIYGKQVEYGFKSLGDLLFRLILIQGEREYSVNQDNIYGVAKHYENHGEYVYIDSDGTVNFTNKDFFKYEYELLF